VQDASRLVDLCRQSLIFDDVAGLRGCLAAIACDPEVHVVRVKNRFAAATSGSAAGSGPGAGGYRDVLVNLCLRTPDAVRLGADNHVCEMQVTQPPPDTQG
jgi:hypothetical protein